MMFGTPTLLCHCLYSFFCGDAMPRTELLPGDGRLVAFAAEPIGKVRLHAVLLSELRSRAATPNRMIQTKRAPLRGRSSATGTQPLCLVLPVFLTSPVPIILLLRLTHRGARLALVLCLFLSAFPAHCPAGLCLFLYALGTNIVFLAPVIEFPAICAVILPVAAHSPSPFTQYVTLISSPG